MDRRRLRSAEFVPVEAKLRPPPAFDHLVPRTSLLERLLSSSNVPVVAISGPPGSGKTVLATQWDSADSRPFGWLTLESTDTDPVGLATYVLLALHRLEAVDVAGSSMLTVPSRPARAVALIAETLRQMKRPFVLVLDGADALTAPGAEGMVQSIAEHLPGGSQVVLVSRASVFLDREKSVSSRTIEVDGADLAFSRPETRALIDAMDLRLPEEDVDELLELTRGWATGIYLTLRALSDLSGDERSAGIPAAQDGIASYFHDEVLDRLPSGVGASLRRTSILRTLSGPLCDAVLGTRGSIDMLRQLVRDNDFIERCEGRAERFRMHPMLAQTLHGDLVAIEPQLLASLHARASSWLEGQGDLDEAIRHAIAAPDPARAARLIWRRAPAQIAAGRTGLVEDWLDAFTPDQVAARSELALAKAWCALVRGRPVDHWLPVVERSAHLAAAEEGVVPVAAGSALLRAMLARNGIAQMAADARLAAANQSDERWACAAGALAGSALLLLDRPAEARASLESAAERAAELDAPHVRALALAELALLLIDDDRWAEAESLAARAIDSLQEHGLADLAVLQPVWAIASLLAAHAGRDGEAEALHRRCLQSLAQTVDPPAWVGAQCREILARGRLFALDAVTAKTLISEAQALLPQLPDAIQLRASIELLVRHIAQLSAENGAAEAILPLTHAELRVLELLPTHLSFEEIGKQLFVSRNTIKTQAVSAYRKLGVSSRSEAVERAAALGLIPR